MLAFEEIGAGPSSALRIGRENPDAPKDCKVNYGKGTRESVARLVGVDEDMSWAKTIPWLRSITKLPIVLETFQCADDAVLAAEAVILISSHCGGLSRMLLFLNLRYALCGTPTGIMSNTF
ncbi:hypothetical protein ACEPAG_8413 [Sanghuangporus baumii]